MAQSTSELKSKDIQLSGKLVTADDGVMIGANFTVLQNMRYTPTHPQGVQGMTKINSTALSNPQVRSAHHFRKAQPVESHLLVQAFDSNGANSKVYTNDTAIPNTGNFVPTALHVDAAGAQEGYFATVPNGSVVYCNSSETLIWGGYESRIGAFVNYDPDSTFKQDFTDVLNNTLSDSANSAVLAPMASSGIDTNTTLLLHLDNSVNDSETYPKTVTNTNVSFSNATYKFGGYSGRLDGSTAYLTLLDAADFDFSGGTWTVDLWYQAVSMASDQCIYSQITDANNWLRIYIAANGSILLKINTAATEATIAATTDALITVDGKWHHIEVSQNAKTYRIFLDGKIRASESTVTVAANYTGLVYIGARSNGSTVLDYLNGYVDEFRVSNVCRHKQNFKPAIVAYNTNPDPVYFYIGVTRPINGVTFYISVPNGQTGATLSASYWDGSGYTPVTSAVDGTSALTQSGAFTFDDTATMAKQSVYDSLVLFWYSFALSKSSATALYYITVSDSMQAIVDVWDGTERTITAFERDSGKTYVDYTNNVYNDTFSTADPTTYCNIASTATSPATDAGSYTGSSSFYNMDFAGGGTGNTQGVVVGFADRMQAIHFFLGGNTVNSTPSSDAMVYFWNGSEWQTVGTVTDGTSANGVTFAKTGIISWNAPDQNLEFKRSLNTQDDTQFYYYRFLFTKTITATRVYHATGIPAAVTIYPYKFPIAAMNRAWLCSEQSGQKNKVICSNAGTCDVYNGDDSATFFFGAESELTGACWLYSQYGTTLYNTLVFTKVNETHILVGNTPSDWAQYQVSPVIGCPAPKTMCVVPGESELYGGTTRAVAIWQGNEAVYMFDGKGFMSISTDIADWFDRRRTYSINRSMLSQSRGFYDALNSEYHWLFASGTSTTLDTEFAYNIPFKKWYQVIRGTGMSLQYGTEILDVQGNTYNYGFVDSGYMERLENGTTFDGNPIACVLELGDNPLTDLWRTSSIRWLELIMVAKTQTINQVLLSHWGDTSEGAPQTLTMSPVNTGHRVASPILSEQTSVLGDNLFRRLGFSLTTTDEPYAFEPLAVSVKYLPKHERIK